MASTQSPEQEVAPPARRPVESSSPDHDDDDDDDDLVMKTRSGTHNTTTAVNGSGTFMDIPSTTSDNIKRKKKPRHSRSEKRQGKAEKEEQQHQQQQQQQTDSHDPVHSHSSQTDSYSFPTTKNGVTNNNSSITRTPTTPHPQWPERFLKCIRKAQRTGSIQWIPTDDTATTTVHSGAVDQGQKQPPPPLQIITSSNLPRPGNSNSSPPSRPMASRIETSMTTTTTTIHIQPLLILDLNGILCHRSRPHKEPIGVRLRPSYGRMIAKTPIIPRPHWISWISSLEEYFVLAIWTSATTKTAYQLLKSLIPSDISKRFLFVWTQKECTPRFHHHHGNDKNMTESKTTRTTTTVIYEKHLSKVWEAYPLWNSHNTILMDDSPDKSPLSQAMNVLHPPPIHGQESEPGMEEVVQDTDTTTTIDGPIHHPKEEQQQRQLLREGEEMRIQSSTTPTTIFSQGKTPHHHPKKVPWQSDEENHHIQEQFFHTLVQYWNVHSHIHQVIIPSGKGSQRKVVVVDDEDDDKNKERKKNITRNEISQNNPPSSSSENKKSTDTKRIMKFSNSEFYNFLRTHAMGHMGWRGNLQPD